MFSSLGLFRQIKCPKQDECGLPACIFSHVKPNCDDVVQADEYDPFSTSYLSPPPAKKMKFDREAIIADVQTQAARMPNPKATESTTDSLKAIAAVAPSAPTKRVASQSQTSNTPIQQLQKTSNSATAVRSISPPPKPEIANPAPAKKEILSARIVPAPPVQLKARNLILQRYYAELQKQNKKVADGGSKWEAFILGDQELITFALDEEEDAARKYNAAVYRNHIGSRMVKVKNMKQDDWRTFIQGTVRKPEKAPSTTFVQPPPRPSTGLSNLKEDVALLRRLHTSLHGLEKFGYVTSPPTAQEIATAKAGVEAAAGYELCDRCNTRFRVFPGRDEEGKLTSGGSCRYHWAKVTRPATSKADRITGGSQPFHPCCGLSPGSEGCVEAETHVFKVTDPKRLASVFQFEETPPNADAQQTPMSFDCEMGYTTLGMEVIRITAVSWPEGKELLDALVRPYGEILELNTRFSGVSKEQFANAIPYADKVASNDTSQDEEMGPQPLRKAESPAAARQLLLSLIAPDTPVIGHAIENDLNVIRLIHPFVIDTVLLYPHSRGLPIRQGLKKLANDHLKRHIQASGAAGHDSKEDAIATGDLVTLRVAEKWKSMKAEGWRVEGGKPIAPEVKKPKATL